MVETITTSLDEAAIAHGSPGLQAGEEMRCSEP